MNMDAQEIPIPQEAPPPLADALLENPAAIAPNPIYVRKDRSMYPPKLYVAPEDDHSKFPKWIWDTQREMACALIVKGATYKAICEKLDVHPNALAKWRKHPVFRDQIEQLREAYRDWVKDNILCTPEGRVFTAAERIEKLNRIVEARAEYYKKKIAEGAEIPGGETGLVYAKPTPYGVELRVDHETRKGLLEEEERIAVEMGQRTKSSGAPAVAIQIVCPTAAPAAMTEAATVDIGVSKR